MIRQWALAGLGALLSLLVSLVPSATRVVVTLDDAPGEPVVGVPFNVGFTIYQEAGEQPQAGLVPLIVVTSASAPDGLRIAARPGTAPGHYVATLILPAAGRWNWKIYPDGDLNQPPEVLRPLQVRDPAGERFDPRAPMGGLGLLALAVGIIAATARLLRRSPAKAEHGGRRV